MMQTLSVAEAFAISGGLFQGLLAVILWRGHPERPGWGLNWLGLCFALASVSNLLAPLLLSGTWGIDPQGLLFAIGAVVGLASLILLVVGLRVYLLVPGAARQPVWRVFLVTLLCFLAGWAVARWLFGPGLAGNLSAGGVFAYLAGLTWHRMRSVAKVGHLWVLSALLMHPVIVFAAAWGGMDGLTLRYWSSLPYATVGLGLVVASLGRLQRELHEELDRRREAESVVRALNESLEHRVEQRTEELQGMVQGLESFNRMVSHDLRGPLGGLSGLAELTVQAWDRGELESGRRMLEMIRSETRRLTELVTSLLCLARVSQSDLDVQSTELDEVLRDAVQVLGMSLGQPAVQCVTAGPLPRIPVDAALMRQVFVNLIGNALKFSAGQPQPQVRVTSQWAGDQCVVSVKDNGAGFPAKLAEDLFQPFRRLHGRVFEGNGVGLTIVRRIVERHGGRVWAESPPGQGATFSFSLPTSPVTV